MTPTKDHYRLMRRLFGSESRRVRCDGRRTDRGYCVGALCPQCRGAGYVAVIKAGSK